MLFEAEVFKLFALALVRFSGLLVAAPVLGSQNFPVMAKAGMAALCAFLVVPTIAALPQPLPAEPLPFALLAAGELAIGLMLGFVMTIAFAAIQVAGEIMDMLTGFAVVNVFNPALGTQVPIFGFFFFLLAALYFLAINGHHMMILALASSFQSVPPGGFVANPELMAEVSTWGGAMFRDGVMMAAPVGGALLLAYITMGLLSRIVPQINLFVVGFPLTIALGLIVAALSIEVYLAYLGGLMDQMFRDLSVAVRGMS